MGRSEKNARFTATCTILLAFFVALIFPVGYFAISYQYATGSLEAEAEINAQIVTGVVQANPEYWRFETDRLQSLLSRRRHAGAPECRAILDATGAVIVAHGGEITGPVISRSQPIIDSGHAVGSIEISRSLVPIIKESAVLAGVGLAIGTLVFILLPFRTISLANTKLRNSYSFLTRVMESGTNAIIVLAEDGTIEMVNGRCTEISGYHSDELCGMNIEALFCGCAATVVHQQLYELSSGAAEIVKFETDLQRKEGSSVTIACGAAPIHQDGRIASIVLSIEDIMERRLAVEQLRHAKEYTENLIQAASVIIVGLDCRGLVTLINGKAEEVTGYSAAGLTGRNWFEAVMGAEAFPDLWRAEAEETGPKVFESEITTRSGSTRTISWRNSPILENGRIAGTLCFGIDITEQRKIEAQLRHSQKMESIGQLAGGVAHDFNNMLSVILGYAQLCQQELPAEDVLSQYVGEIARAGERSKEMVRQLLAFSRKEIISPRVVNLNAHYIETEKTLSRLLGEEIRLTFLPSSGLWAVKIDPYQADQILINLAVNARDAMPGGGNLTLETENVVVDEAYCDYRLDAKPGEYTCLMVSDTGMGMDRELVKRIFEPFFTTKEVGKGTGLGLATVYGIVTQNGGFIDVESESGVGTTFKIFLPRLIEQDDEQDGDAVKECSGSGTILVVEDDDAMRSIATRMLEKMGYSVLQAESPRRALAICRDQLIGIDLVLSDVVMPEMNGKEMAQEISQLRPGTGVLFMSGYSSDIVAKRGVLEHGMHYIQKPFDMEVLHTKLQELREQSSGGTMPGVTT
jgi:two-component system, cell cycle sensor histidine kinase and response regulator CckA